MKRRSCFQAKKNCPDKNQKHVENFIFRCGFKECVLVENGAIFAIFFRFRPPSPLLGMLTEPFLAPTWAKNAEKVYFPGLGGRSGRNTRPPSLITC